MYLTDDMWLDKDDFAELERLFSDMEKKLVNGDCPVALTPSPTFRGIPIKSAGEGHPQITEVRAQFVPSPSREPSRSSIRLTPFPLDPEAYAGLREDIDHFRRWVKPIIGHEFVHAKQFLSSYYSEKKAKCASSRGKTARDSNKYEDYVRYVSHPYELSAHATQISIEIMLDMETLNLEERTFSDICTVTNVWKHMIGWGAASEEQRTSAFASIEGPLREAAWKAYREMS